MWPYNHIEHRGQLKGTRCLCQVWRTNMIGYTQLVYAQSDRSKFGVIPESAPKIAKLVQNRAELGLSSAPGATVAQLFDNGPATVGQLLATLELAGIVVGNFPGHVASICSATL